MKRGHDMPFGAALENDGVRFRLWAPASRRVAVCFGDGHELSMDPAGGGFFERFVQGTGPGTRYGFRIDAGDLVVPDPASRCNPDDVHGPSEVIDPTAFHWEDDQWSGRPWEEAVVYELHVGAFSDRGDFAGVEERLGYLAELGVTTVELMPVAEFAGGRGWGYDGVLPFAPECGYGRPEDLKGLVQSAHGLGLMVILDVVYNHFGPEGNYLHRYAPQFFTDRVPTPWGEAIDFEGAAARTVRDFFIHNALYWLQEFNVDGLRIDAVHAIYDRSRPDILEELADRVREAAAPGRQIHLVLENDNNAAHYLRRAGAKAKPRFDAQWNDDFHHVLHVLLTGERSSYYADYADDPVRWLVRCLSQGFAYQGDWSDHRERPRGEGSADLPTSAFITFLQNHDQVGNRAFGERLVELAPPDALAAAQAILLLAPYPPLLFMGEEFAASSRFPFFCEMPPELGVKIAAGRRREFQRFPQFRDPKARKLIPDPNDPATFRSAKLLWAEAVDGAQEETHERYRNLLRVRRTWLTPRLPGRGGRAQRLAERALTVCWDLADGARWHLLLNVGGPSAEMDLPAGRCAYASFAQPATGRVVTLPSWAAAAYLEE